MRVTEETKRIVASAAGFAPPANARQCVDAYVAAVADGIPRSLAREDRTLGSVGHESSRDQGRLLVSTFELALPDLSRAALRPLGSIFQCASERSAMTEIAIEELGPTRLEPFLLSELPHFTKAKWPFSFQRARA